MAIYENYSELSLKLTKLLSKDDKKNNGIYFTPLDIIKLSIKELFKLNININSILEPSCGSCEFIYYIDEKFFNSTIDAIEFNDKIYTNIKNITIKNNILNIYNYDYLEYDKNHNYKYDLIIGNPPYYVMKNQKNKKYKDFYEGRPNIFILFIIHSLYKLNINGILLFVLPKSFLNCIYYNKLRSHIYKNYNIVNILDCSKSNYIETEQETIILIIQNNGNINNDKFAINTNEIIIFNTDENIQKLKELYNNSVSLNQLNFEVKVGNIVWNQHKLILTDDKAKTRLIYSSDIKNAKLFEVQYKNKNKKNYIEKEGINGPLLVVNRGYGKGEYKFNYCLINVEYNYLIENHLICIKSKDSKISVNRLLELYTKIINSFKNEKTKEFVKIYFGNNSINTTELQFLLPIY